jgi:hypothetical protein
MPKVPTHGPKKSQTPPNSVPEGPKHQKNQQETTVPREMAPQGMTKKKNLQLA